MRWFLKPKHIMVLCLFLSAGWVLMTVSAEVEQNTRAENPDNSFESDPKISAQESSESSQERQPTQQESRPNLQKIIQSFYPPLTKVEQATQKELDTETKADFRNEPLVEVMVFIQKQHGVNIFLDGQALEQVGLTAKEPVNVSLNGIKLKSALDIILEPLGLDYVIDGEVLKVTSIEEANHTLKVRVYPVADLGSSAEEFEALENAIRNTCLPPSSMRHKTYPVDDLVIGGSGKSTSKSSVSDSSRSISVVPQCQALVVKETDRVHLKISELLSQLRQVREDQASLSSDVK
ncbi:hypothetical protein [Gimesia sp.]|uniref:hypothetical protein n=1 Tax=Gimesia sp. TaxID=2024833 RepID=UPI003A91FE89